MAIPPFVNTRLNKGEKLDERKAEELFDAMTRNFEDLYNRVQTQEAANEAGNEFLRLVSKGKHKINWGTASLTWTAAQFSAEKEITHKLGVAPTAVLLNGHNANLGYACTTKGTTTFKASGWANVAISGTFEFDWIALA